MTCQGDSRTEANRVSGGGDARVSTAPPSFPPALSALEAATRAQMASAIVPSPGPSKPGRPESPGKGAGPGSRRAQPGHPGGSAREGSAPPLPLEQKLPSHPGLTPGSQGQGELPTRPPRRHRRCPQPTVLLLYLEDVSGGVPPPLHCPEPALRDIAVHTDGLR